MQWPNVVKFSIVVCFAMSCWAGTVSTGQPTVNATSKSSHADRGQFRSAILAGRAVAYRDHLRFRRAAEDHRAWESVLRRNYSQLHDYQADFLKEILVYLNATEDHCDLSILQGFSRYQDELSTAMVRLHEEDATFHEAALSFLTNLTDTLRVLGRCSPEYPSPYEGLCQHHRQLLHCIHGQIRFHTAHAVLHHLPLIKPKEDKTIDLCQNETALERNLHDFKANHVTFMAQINELYEGYSKLLNDVRLSFGQYLRKCLC